MRTSWVATSKLSDLVNVLMDTHRTDWRTTEFHSRNIAALVCAYTPADWGNGLFRLSAVTLRTNSSGGIGPPEP